MKRRAFIGDLHGRIDEYKQMVARLKEEGVEEIWHAGDLVDRGIDSHAVVEYCRLNGIKGVQGNHDGVIVHHWEMMKLAGHPTTKNPDKLNTLSQMTQEDIDYLKSLPLLAVFDDIKLVLVHGGLFPKLALHEQLQLGNSISRAQLIHPDKPGAVRWWGTDKSGRPEEENRAEGWVRWYEAYDWDYDVVFGHSGFMQPFVHQNPGCGRTIGIDTGIADTLTAVIMPDLKFVSIPVIKENYAKHCPNWVEKFPDPLQKD